MSKNRRAWLGAAAGLALALLAAHVVLSLFDFGDRKFVRHTERPIQDWIYEILMVGAAVAVFARAIVVRRHRLGWLLVGISLTFDAGADLYYILAFGEGQIPFPSVADAIYFASYPAAVAGVLMLAGRTPGVSFASSALLVTVLGLATAWSWFVFEPVVSQTTGTTGEVLTTLAYPLFDLALIAIVLVSLASRGWRLDASYLILVAGFAVLPIADGVYAVQEATGVYKEWTILDTMWPLSSVMIAGAAWLHAGRRGRQVDVREMAMALTTAAVALAIVALIWDHYDRLDTVTVTLAGVTLVVAIIELFVLNRARERAELRALAAAAENEGLAAIVRSSEDAIISADLEGIVTAWNHGAQAIYGYTNDETIGRSIRGLTIPEGQEEEVDRLIEAVAGGEPAAFETQRRRKNGELVDVSLRAFPVRDGAGSVVGISVSAHDITERRRREEQEQRDREGRLWRGRIKSALANDRFAFWGQPVVDLASGDVDHYELLLRMMHDDEAISPGLFMAHAESSDLIRGIDRWAVRRGIAFAHHVPVAVNLSARSLGDRELIGLIRSTLESSPGVAPNLTFEITETAAAENLEGATQTVGELRSLGCRVALDDFGTGFNSFTYLKHLPVTSLKIDLQFVRQLSEDPSNERIVSSIVSIARSFEMTTVAEGVEDQATLDVLRELGVDAVQGFYVGYPARMTTTPQAPKLMRTGS